MKSIITVLFILITFSTWSQDTIKESDTMFYEPPKSYPVWVVKEHVLGFYGWNTKEYIVFKKNVLDVIIEKFKKDKLSSSGKNNYITIREEFRFDKRLKK